jgi:hypothetical protein
MKILALEHELAGTNAEYYQQLPLQQPEKFGSWRRLGLSARAIFVLTEMKPCWYWNVTRCSTQSRHCRHCLSSNTG